MTPAPRLSPFSTANPIGTIFGSVGHGMWLAATSSLWLDAVFCLLIVSVMARVYRAIRWAPIAAAGLDPVRRFSGVDRAAIFSRAGARCERHSLLFGRCQETEKLHADHVHPHSKGGSTTVANGQVLCSRHNKQKAARIPFNWELRRLEKQRASYFPAGDSGAVVRRASRRAPDGW
jgi:HNH endonuclease